MCTKVAKAASENMKLLKEIRRFPGLVCTKPWTSLLEASHDGLIKPCTWSKCYIGNVGSGSTEKLLNIWNGEKIRKIRELLLLGKYDKVCRKDCPILFDRDAWFEKQEFYDYSANELNSFDGTFLLNRKNTMQSILNKETIVSTMPLRLKIHPTNTCNLRCTHCQLDKEENIIKKKWYFNGELDYFKSFLEELKVFGGEPFACSVSQRVIFNGSPIHVNHSFVTNGTMLNMDTIKKLESLRIGWIDVSLDSSKKLIYESIRIGSAFEKVYDNLKKLIKSRKRHIHRKFPIFANFVIQKKNFREIEDFVYFCHTLDMKPNFSLLSGSYELSNHIPEVKKYIKDGMSKSTTIGDENAYKSLDYVMANINNYHDRIRRPKLISRIKGSTIVKFAKF